MSVVTDPELIKKLKEKQQKGTDTPVGVVTDPELIKTLQQKQTKLIEDMPVEPVEDTKPSAVEEPSGSSDSTPTLIVAKSKAYIPLIPQ